MRRGSAMKPERATAIVLCGGRGTRLAGADKALLQLGGKPLIAHVIERLRPQVAKLVLACGQSEREYLRFGQPLVTDEQPGEGPLGGIVSCLREVSTPWLLTTPGDTPFLPTDLVAALAPTCRRAGAAVVTAGGVRQNLALLLDAGRAATLARFYRSGGRAVYEWLDANNVPAVELPAAGFLNVNTEADLRAASERLTGDGDPCR